MNAVDISVAVPTYNRKEMLKKALACLTTQNTGGLFTYEVIVIDDVSDDGTKEVVLELAEKAPVTLRYVLGRGMGYTHALNTAVSEAKGEWLAFFDDDQLTHPNWLKAFYTAAKEQKAAMVGGPIALEVPDHIRKTMGPVYLDICGETHDITYPERYVDRNPLPPGGNRMIKYSIFMILGTFDESMLTGGCDRDFLRRAVAAGYTMGWAKDADIKHCIPLQRITPQHMKWYSLQRGVSFAYQDWKRLGSVKASFSAIARIGQALLVHFPLLCLAYLKKDQVEKQDRIAFLWRAVGFVKKILALLSPTMFPQEKFFSKVEFRRSRVSEKKDTQ
jgi:glycosyltransferase involved in cell wall biosynthesis